MTKLADFRVAVEEYERGEWLRVGESTLYLRVRGLGYGPYQRALRRRDMLNGAAKPPAEMTPDEKLDAEEKSEREAAPLIGEHLVADWFGADADTEPLAELEGAEAETVATVGGEALVAYVKDGKRYRKTEDGKYQELAPWSVEASVAVFSDPGQAHLLNFVKQWAMALYATVLSRSKAIAKKSPQRPNGQ
jgi:hypothetical protein